MRLGPSVVVVVIPTAPEPTPQKASGETASKRRTILGLERPAAGVVLLVLGVLILVFPAVLRWAVGAAALVAGILLLGLGTPSSSSADEPNA